MKFIIAPYDAITTGEISSDKFHNSPLGVKFIIAPYDAITTGDISSDKFHN